MKAVIMAGGEGTRLRPLSLGLPKPMTPLFDRPVMEHIIGLLKRHGITDICVTLQYMPQAIMNYFGDGSTQGVHLTYFIEESPLGTAGSVKGCMKYLGDEDFLVISGDAVCDLDLSAAIGFHRSHRSAATLVLHPHPAPLEYGLVLTDEEGKVQEFIEKPSWGQVLTNMVNTGIYLLTSHAMSQVPDGERYDFGKDLFPRLLEQGECLYGFGAEGYWCDMGDAEAYLQCMSDALSGRVQLDLGAPRVAPGVWADSPIPEGVELVPPCYIGKNVSIGVGSLVGPHAALGRGSTIGTRTLVQRSVLHAARVGDRCTLYGTILCRDASARSGCVLNEGTVLGEDATVGQDAILMENVKVWPNRTVEAGCRLTASLTTGGLRRPLKFGDGGVIRGTAGEELTPELLLLLGNALGGDGQAGLGHSGGEGAQMLARAAESGMAAAGCRVLDCDAPCPSAAAWLAETYALPVTLFIEQEGENCYLHLFDRRGLPLGRGRERKIEGAMLRGEMSRVGAGRVGRVEQLTGVRRAYVLDAARRGQSMGTGSLTVSVLGTERADACLAGALTALGCTVLGERKKGVPAFETAHGGFHLRAWDEEGRLLESERVLVLAALVALLDGEKRLSVRAGAPATLDLMATRYGAVVLRLGRDGSEAEERYAAQPALRDAVFAAARICAYLIRTGETLRTLDSKAPLFAVRRQEVPLHGNRAEVMQALAKDAPKAQRAGEGIRLAVGEGWVFISPLIRRQSLRVIGEGLDAETAEELCVLFAEKARRLDETLVPDTNEP